MYMRMYYEHLIWTSLYENRYLEIFMDEISLKLIILLHTYFCALLLTKSKELIFKMYTAIMYDQLCCGTNESI